MNEWKEKIRKLEIYKYPLIILLIGAALMLFPTRKEEAGHSETVEQALEETLASSMGVGAIRILVSENGAVIVCEGADNPTVKLDILRAIGSYTGLGSDKITILKMSNQKGR